MAQPMAIVKDAMVTLARLEPVLVIIILLLRSVPIAIVTMA